MGPPNLQSWVSRVRWNQRIATFSSAWFTCTMGTGAIAEILANFPYPAEWLIIVAYCFWVLTMVLFIFFTILGLLRLLKYPSLSKEIFQDLRQASFLGAIPISVLSIAAGICIFYDDRPGAIWAAYGLWWLAVAMSIGVCCNAMLVMSKSHGMPFENITGVYMLAYIPFIVAAATGSILAPHLPQPQSGTTLLTCFLLVTAGLTATTLLTAAYATRLLTNSRLPLAQIHTVFMPTGPPSMAAYCVQNLASTLATEYPSPATHAISLLGTGAALALLAGGSLAVLLAAATLAVRRVFLPPAFAPTIWATVFPLAVYGNAVGRVAQAFAAAGQRSIADVLRAWGAAGVVATVIAWAVCAGWCFWRGVWRGEIVGGAAAAPAPARKASSEEDAGWSSGSADEEKGADALSGGSEVTIGGAR